MALASGSQCPLDNFPLCRLLYLPFFDLAPSKSTTFRRSCNNWCQTDITSPEGSKIDTIASGNGLNQLIQEPTHILNSSSSCIDLIFTLQPNLVMESGIHSSLHSNCHHQIVFAKFNLSIFYPPPYERTVWYYERANTELIRRAIDQFDWLRALSNLNVDEKFTSSPTG